MEERRAKAICFNCDRKYGKGHKCGDKKLLYIDYEQEEANEQEPSQSEEIEETPPKKITPTIFCHALDGFSTPKTLKSEGYIKKR